MARRRDGRGHKQLVKSDTQSREWSFMAGRQDGRGTGSWSNHAHSLETERGER